MVVASSSGGMEIEEIAVRSPQSILRTVVEPAVGMQAFQAREIAFGLIAGGGAERQAGRVVLVDEGEDATRAANAHLLLGFADQGAGKAAPAGSWITS